MTAHRSAAMLWLCITLSPLRLAGAAQLEDTFGRDLDSHGVTLVDWEGYLSNPAIQLTLIPPPGALYPALAHLQGDHVRLYFNNPCAVGVSGPTKTLNFPNATPQSFYLSIFPDRSGGHEEYTLRVIFQDFSLPDDTTEWDVHVIDQDTARPLEFHITLDFSKDPNVLGFLVNPADTAERRVIQQAADDWAYFIADMNFDSVAVGSESTPLWFNDFTGTTTVTNSMKYSGFLIYPYGHHNSVHRSGGAGSFAGQLQRIGGIPLGLKRSGAYEVEVHGNFNLLGWYLASGDDDWAATSLLGGEVADLYSVAMHEMGHCIGYNVNHSAFAAFKALGSIQDSAVLAYQGHYPLIDGSDHLGAEHDRISLDGAYGNDYYGFNPGEGIPLARWMITKLHVLGLQALGYVLRPTSPFAPVDILTDSLGTAYRDYPFAKILEAQGGILTYNWTIVSGSLPPGYQLDSYTGEISGTTNATGSYSLWVEVEDYDGELDSQAVDLQVLVQNCPISQTGDVNESGSLTSADIIMLVNYVFKGGAVPLPCEANGDVNCTGAVTSADVITIVNYVFKSGLPPCDVCTLVPATWSCL